MWLHRLKVKPVPKSTMPWCQWCGVTGTYVPEYFVGGMDRSADCCIACIPHTPHKLAFFYNQGHKVFLQALEPTQGT